MKDRIFSMQPATGPSAADAAVLVGRHLAVPGTVNLRDVGGYPAAGGTVRWGLLYRCDALYGVPEEGVAELAGMKLNSVLDLRTKAERQNAPAPTDSLSSRGIVTTWMPLLEESAAQRKMGSFELNLHMVRNRGEAIGRAFAALCEPAALPALIHCTAGKDRTGLLIALVLAVLGVPDEVIAADYALSALFVDPDYVPERDAARERERVKGWLTRELATDRPGHIQSALECIRASHRSAVRYLKRNKVTERQIVRLRAALLDGRMTFPPGGQLVQAVVSKGSLSQG